MNKSKNTNQSQSKCMNKSRNKRQSKSMTRKKTKSKNKCHRKHKNMLRNMDKNKKSKNMSKNTCQQLISPLTFWGLVCARDGVAAVLTFLHCTHARFQIATINFTTCADSTIFARYMIHSISSSGSLVQLMIAMNSLRKPILSL